ncbi:MAG: hypothetical protein PHF56_01910 [Desulfuromonadaceae bacterium]|nr:hypothetical protein [Desulfuromonadaceae bacterium]
MTITLPLSQFERKLAGLYSADVIPDGKVRGLFTYSGKNFVITGLFWSDGLQVANATEAVPLKHWSGNVCCYHEKQIVTDEDRQRLYEGVKVKCKGELFVLSGQRIEFSPDRSKPAAAQPTQMALF